MPSHPVEPGPSGLDGVPGQVGLTPAVDGPGKADGLGTASANTTALGGEPEIGTYQSLSSNYPSTIGMFGSAAVPPELPGPETEYEGL